MEEVRTKRTYHRRSPEEIAADKAEKEAKKIEREAKKAEKEAKKIEREAKKADSDKKKVVAKAAKAESEKIKKDKAEKGNGHKPIMPKKGQWSSSTNSMIYEKMFIEIKLLESCLGTCPSDKELLETYIAKNAPDAVSKQEEIDQLGDNEVFEKGTTVFARGHFMPSENGEHMIDILDRKEGFFVPEELQDKLEKRYFFWNYCIRGMFKDACGLLSRGNYGLSANLSAYKKVVDGAIFVSPRRLAITIPEVYYDDDGNKIVYDPEKPLTILQRPLLIKGLNERTAIASSEMIPAGSTIKFCINYTDKKFHDNIVEWLNYGAEHGLGAWRNSGRGTFIWRELQSDWSPYPDDCDE